MTNRVGIVVQEPVGVPITGVQAAYVRLLTGGLLACRLPACRRLAYRLPACGRLMYGLLCGGAVGVQMTGVQAAYVRLLTGGCWLAN